MNIAIYTLGCKVNQYETAAMERELTARGHTLVPFEGPADACIINTCTVTAVSDKKSRQMIRRARKQSPGAVVAVCGCYPQTHPEDVKGLDVDLIAGTGDRMKFLDLLEQAAHEKEPVVNLDEALCRRTAALPNLCPHFHLSLQSGCDATLARMNRKYDTRRYKESADLLNGAFRRPAITTDLIAGFPGETEEEFAATLDFIRSCGFAEMHIFPYSIRPGTPAAEMEQVPGAVKDARAARAAAVAEEMHQAYLEDCVGQIYDVLYEQPTDGLYQGHAPNYMLTAVPAGDLHNRILPTRITGVENGVLLGELV